MTDPGPPALPSSGPAPRARLLPTSGRRTAALAALLLIPLAALGCANLARWPSTGAHYSAKQLCSCLFVAGRSEASCRGEFSRFIDRYQVRIDRQGLPRTARVTTRLALWSGEAVYEDGYGCRIAR